MEEERHRRRRRRSRPRWEVNWGWWVPFGIFALILVLGPLLFGAIGIALVATSAAALNCVIEQKLDAMMARTRARPLDRAAMGSILARLGLRRVPARIRRNRDT